MSNPPNRFGESYVEWDEEPPPRATLDVFVDASKSILSKNDSPDVPFTWSVNPYRGCTHACAYCMVGDTPILLADGRTRPLAELEVGDEIVGTVRSGRYRRYVATRVLAHWSTVKPAWRITLEDGTSVIASADHRFLSGRGWKHVTGAEHGAFRRPHLRPGQVLLGMGGFATAPHHSEAYRRGYLCGMVRGDGLLGSYSYDGRAQHQFRLALVDDEALDRSQAFLADFGITTNRFRFRDREGQKPMNAIRTHARGQVEQIRALIAWPDRSGEEWDRGFLAGIFDAEGSYSRGILRITNTDRVIVDRVVDAIRRFGFDAVIEERRRPTGPIFDVRVRGGLGQHLRFFHSMDPAITRKRAIVGQAIKNPEPLKIATIEPVGLDLPMYDITTGTGDFVANGVVSHNCYARPFHEYLGLGAGTDFESVIFVKPDAPELLAEAFRKPSWQGENVVFSGVTDCYQPLERRYEVTRKCLQVCAAFHNPAGIMTRSPLVARDIDVLQELDRVAQISVTMSLPILDRETCAAIEPGAPAPHRRLAAMKALADAGIPVGLNLSPMIPTISDRQIPDILKAARDAGARWAACVHLRLPGAVATVFEERVRKALPDKADAILARQRRAHGGRLNDPRFDTRWRGSGPEADAVTALFDLWRDKLGYEGFPLARPSTFRRPPPRDQLGLFG